MIPRDKAISDTYIKSATTFGMVEYVKKIYDSIGCCGCCTSLEMKKMFPMGMDTGAVPYCNLYGRVKTINGYCDEFTKRRDDE
jgi:hypothetical protein